MLVLTSKSFQRLDDNEKITKLITEVSNGKDVYYVDGLVNEVLITINQDENHRMIDGFFQVDQVYDRKKQEIEPVEGMEVMAVRIRHGWKFVKDDIISLIFPLIFTSLHVLAALTTTKGFFFKEK